MSTLSTPYLTKRADWSRIYTFTFAVFAEPAGGETLSSPVVTGSPTGLTIGTPSVSGSTVTVRISGGTAGVTYDVTCAVTLSSGGALSMVGHLVVES